MIRVLTGRVTGSLPALQMSLPVVVSAPSRSRRRIEDPPQSTMTSGDPQFEFLILVELTHTPRCILCPVAEEGFLDLASTRSLATGS